MAIAIFSAAARNFTWIAVLLGLVGTLFMLYGSVLLIVESRMALSAIMTEMDFVWKVSRKYAGPSGDEDLRRPLHMAGQENHSSLASKLFVDDRLEVLERHRADQRGRPLM